MLSFVLCKKYGHANLHKYTNHFTNNPLCVQSIARRSIRTGLARYITIYILRRGQRKRAHVCNTHLTTHDKQTHTHTRKSGIELKCNSQLLFDVVKSSVCVFFFCLLGTHTTCRRYDPNTIKNTKSARSVQYLAPICWCCGRVGKMLGSCWSRTTTTTTTTAVAGWNRGGRRACCCWSQIVI